MLSDYIPVLIQVVLASGFAVATLIASALLGKRALTNKTKDSAYECGMNPIGEGQARFSVKFYLVAMLFVLFDIEVVFLYPWAVAFNQLGLYGFIAASTFLLMLFAGLVYEWRKGALEWV
jgi:NADH-quinone oxidoreductase subunit A